MTPPTASASRTAGSAPGDFGRGTDSVPLFAFPGAGELLDEIAQLARHLQGVRVLGYCDPTPLAERGNMSIEAGAGRSIAGLRAVQPEGPYHLIGYCCVYRGRPYAGPVIHFGAAAAGNGSRLDRRNGWPECCTGRYDLIWVDASHDEIMGSRVAS